MDRLMKRTNSNEAYWEYVYEIDVSGNRCSMKLRGDSVSSILDEVTSHVLNRENVCPGGFSNSPDTYECIYEFRSPRDFIERFKREHPEEFI